MPPPLRVAFRCLVCDEVDGIDDPDDVAFEVAWICLRCVRDLLAPDPPDRRSGVDRRQLDRLVPPVVRSERRRRKQDRRRKS